MVQFLPIIFPSPLTQPPFPECVRVISKWYDQGHNIVIFSCRANPLIKENTGQTDEEWLDSYKEMIDYLKKYNVPYHRIDTSKPFYKVLICDRALNGARRWSEIESDVENKNYGRSHKHN